MAEFSGDSQSFKLSSLPFLAMDSTMGYTDHQFEDLNTQVLSTPTFSLQRLMGFSSDSFLPQQPEFPDLFADSLWSFPISVPAAQSVGSMEDENRESKKRKATAVSSTSSGKSSSQVSDIGFEAGSDKTNRKNCSVKGKKEVGNEKQEGPKEVIQRKGNEEQEVPKEVIHVRARRGQATDSHSLAERVRRERINKRMTCLRDLVPGCHKTMGTAVMLDEVINYVQLLQNQVEFLSMKLSAASYFYDFSLDTEATVALQATTSHLRSQSLRRTAKTKILK